MDRSMVYLGVYDTMADWEPGYAASHIRKAAWQKNPDRYQVRTVGETRDPITTMGGICIKPDVTLDDIDPDSAAMLILPGSDISVGGGTKAFVAKAADLLEVGASVAAICGATAALSEAGLLDERRHTSNAREFLAMTGYLGAEHYVEEPAVRDQRVITASGVYPVEFAVEIFKQLDLYTPAVLSAWYKIYGLKDPSGYYELMEVTQ